MLKLALLLGLLFSNGALAADTTYTHCRETGYAHKLCFKAGEGYTECREAGYSHANCYQAGKGYLQCREKGYPHQQCYQAENTPKD